MEENKIIELIKRAKNHDEVAIEELFGIFKPKVIAISREYFLVGAEFDDLLQEGMIGLYKAVLGYDGERDASFGTFASLCIRRQIVSAVRSAARLKNAPLNDYVSLFGGDGDEDVLVKQATPNPEDDFIRQESEQLMREKLNRLLSQFEWQVLGLFLAGKSYREIADTVGKDTKAVDNALSRIRQKLMKENPV